MSTDFHTLSNGRYVTFLSAAGTGYSTWNGLALTRWNADPVEDNDGFFLYLRDSDSGEFWSLGQQPVFMPMARYACRFGQGIAELRCEYGGVEAEMTVIVPDDADVEWRRVILRNASDRPRRIELTSYAEVVLNVRAADAAHPAFSKLFVQTEFDPGSEVLLARRRPRAMGEPVCWLVHALSGDGTGRLGMKPTVFGSSVGVIRWLRRRY